MLSIEGDTRNVTWSLSNDDTEITEMHGPEPNYGQMPVKIGGVAQGELCRHDAMGKTHALNVT